MKERRNDDESSASLSDDPFRDAWTTPFGIPPFDRIAPEHCCLRGALSEQRAEIERIAREAAAPSFDNTLAALERSDGR